MAAVGLGVPLLIFAALAAFVAPREPGAIDRAVFAHLYSGVSDWPLGPTPGQDNPFLERVMPQLFRLTDDREIALVVAFTLLGLLITKHVRAALFLIAGLLIGLAAPVVKTLFDRGSPFPLPGDNAFPSGHGMATMALGGIVVILAWRTRWAVPVVVLAGLFVLAIGSAVIADGGHWLSDVIAGWCLAIAWLTILCLCVARLADTRSVGEWLRTPGWPRSDVPG